jgi:hypothetical protein
MVTGPDPDELELELEELELDELELDELELLLEDELLLDEELEDDEELDDELLEFVPPPHPTNSATTILAMARRAIQPREFCDIKEPFYVYGDVGTTKERWEAGAPP